MPVRLVPVGHLRSSQSDIDPATLARVERYLRSHGWSEQVPPLTVLAYPDGDYIVDGHHRAEAARRVGIAEVPVMDRSAMSRSDIARHAARVRAWRVLTGHPRARNPSGALDTVAQIDEQVSTPTHVRESIEDFVAAGLSVKEIVDWFIRDLSADGTAVRRSAAEAWVRREIMALQGLIKREPAVAGPEGAVFLEIETRPSALPGKVLRRWVVTPAGERDIVGLQLRETRRPDRYVIVHPSTTGKRWQATWFDADGAGGDIRRDTLTEALDQQAPAGEYTVEEVRLRHGRVLTIDREDAMRSNPDEFRFTVSVRDFVRAVWGERLSIPPGAEIDFVNRGAYDLGGGKTAPWRKVKGDEVVTIVGNPGRARIEDDDGGWIADRLGTWVGAREIKRLQAVAGERRGNPSGEPAKAIRLFRRFHTRDFRGHGELAIEIPDTVVCIGDAVHTDYRSDKLNPSTGEDEGTIDYTHKHDGGVKVYRPQRGGGDVRVPAWIRNVDQVTWLGQCLCFGFRDGHGVHEGRGTAPLPDLFAIPSGKALLVVQSKRTLLALIWGGRLTVEHRGIVH